MSSVAVIAISLSNIPEGLSSAAGMKKAKRGPLYIFGIWTGIALISGLASLLGCTLFRGASPDVIALTIAVAAGAILSMLVDTMIPEHLSKLTTSQASSSSPDSWQHFS